MPSPACRRRGPDAEHGLRQVREPDVAAWPLRRLPGHARRVGRSHERNEGRALESAGLILASGRAARRTFTMYVVHGVGVHLLDYCKLE